MPPRRPHTKSRLGCIRCKEKHIKCDEIRPTCGACARVEVPCILKEPHRQRISFTQQHTVGPQGTQNDSQVMGTTAATSSTLVESPQSIGLSMWEFEVIHYYIIHVADTFDSNAAVCSVLKNHAIKAATQHRFLMHITLMISCLHMGVTKSPMFTDGHHQFIQAGCSGAMSRFREELEVINDSNWRTVAPFAFLMSVYALALPLLDDVHKSADTIIDDSIKVFSLLRGTHDLTDMVCMQTAQDAEPWTRQEDLRDVTKSMPPEDFDVELVTEILTHYISISGDEPQVQAINLRAVRGFQEACEFNVNKFLRPVIWPNELDQDFLTLLTQRNQTSMAILAHHGVSLGQCSSKWWCADWGSRLVSAVAVLLPSSFAGAIAYPLEKLNLG